MTENSKVIVIVGATATNKTNVAIALAKATNGENVNADAFQVYRELNIGVNKPSKQEQIESKFHLLGQISITQEWDIKKFQIESMRIIQDIYAHKKIPIVVGGSHLYVDALINNYDLDNSLQRTNQFDHLTNNELYEKLLVLDPTTAQKITIHNRKRLLRALEILNSGKQIKKTKCSIFEPLFIICTKPREKLYEDINKRVDVMIRNGWFEEVQALIKKHPNILSLNAFKAIGYQEIATGLLLPIAMIDIDKIKQRTRQYAKRQLTWIKHHYQDKNTYIYTQDNLDDVIKHVQQWISK